MVGITYFVEFNNYVGINTAASWLGIKFKPASCLHTCITDLRGQRNLWCKHGRCSAWEPTLLPTYHFFNVILWIFCSQNQHWNEPFKAITWFNWNNISNGHVILLFPSWGTFSWETTIQCPVGVDRKEKWLNTEEYGSLRQSAEYCLQLVSVLMLGFKFQTLSLQIRPSSLGRSYSWCSE